MRYIWEEGDIKTGLCLRTKYAPYMIICAVTQPLGDRYTLVNLKTGTLLHPRYEAHGEQWMSTLQLAEVINEIGPSVPIENPHG